MKSRVVNPKLSFGSSCQTYKYMHGCGNKRGNDTSEMERQESGKKEVKKKEEREKRGEETKK